MWFACTLTLAACVAEALDARGWPPQTPAGQAAASALPVSGTGLILGQVVDAAGGGVPGVVVALSGGLIQMGGFNTNLTPASIPGGPRRALTNGDGRFVFADLPKGWYSIDATKPGYVSGAFGRHRPGGVAQSFELADGERNGGVKIAIWKYAAISGTVIDDAGEPLVGASVLALRRSYDVGRTQLTASGSSVTDDRGAYRIATLTPGEYIVCITASQTTVPVAIAEAYAQARLAGTTTDFSRQMSSAGASFSLGAVSAGIRVGDFVLQNSGPFSRSGAVAPEPSEDGRLLSFQTTFYPGVFALAQAEVFTLASGDERSGIEMHLKLVPTVPVAGTIVGPDGPMPNIGVRLVPGYADDLSYEQNFDSAATLADATGAFRFLGVPVGQYTLRVMKVPIAPAPVAPTVTTVIQAGSSMVTMVSGPPNVTPPPIPPGPTLWANMPITVGEDGAPNITVRLNSGFHISGRFEFDGTIPRPPPNIVQTMYMLLQPIDGHQTSSGVVLTGRTDPDGTFTTYEIPPGQYSVRMAAPQASWLAIPGWQFRSSVVDGRDCATVPLDLQGDVSGLVITMTDHPSELSGTVRDENGRLDPKAAVLVLSANRTDWSNFGETPRRLRNLRPTPSGVYKVLGLPPGPYLIAAIPDAQAGDWQDPRFLQLVSRTALRITLGDGEKKTQDVVTRPVR